MGLDDNCDEPSLYHRRKSLRDQSHPGLEVIEHVKRLCQNVVLEDLKWSPHHEGKGNFTSEPKGSVRGFGRLLGTADGSWQRTPSIFHSQTFHSLLPQNECCLTWCSQLFPGLAAKWIFPPHRIGFRSYSFSLLLKKEGALGHCLLSLLTLSTPLELNWQKQGFTAPPPCTLRPSSDGGSHQSRRVCLGSSMAPSTWNPCSVIRVSWAG